MPRLFEYTPCTRSHGNVNFHFFSLYVPVFVGPFFIRFPALVSCQGRNLSID